MVMIDFFDTFFSKRYENELSMKMLELGFVFPEEEVLSYIQQIVEMPYKEYLYFVRDNVMLSRITTQNIPQFSSIEDGTSRLCEKMKALGDTGFTMKFIGKVLLDDGKERKDCALSKYGENHLKFARLLGLTHEYYGPWYLTPLGYCFSQLKEETKSALLARTVLRDPLFYKMISDSSNGVVNITSYLDILSLSTKKRRMPNVLSLLRLIQNQCRKENIKIIINSTNHSAYLPMSNNEVIFDVAAEESSQLELI